LGTYWRERVQMEREEIKELRKRREEKNDGKM
jgi:hypothetical protein